MPIRYTVRDRLRPLVSRFSRRTFGILLCVYIWALIGWGQYIDVPIPRPGVFHLLIPGIGRALLWWIPALVGLICAWSHRASSVALGVLWVSPGLCLVSYAIGWALSKVPGGNPGYPNGWYSSALFLGVVGIVIVTALLPAKAKGAA